MKKIILLCIPLLLMCVACEERHKESIDKNLLGTWERVSETMHMARPDGSIKEENENFVKRTITFKRNWRVQIQEENNTGAGTYFIDMDAFMQGSGEMDYYQENVKYLYIFTPSGEGEFLDYTISPDTLWTRPGDPVPGGNTTHKYVRVK